MRADVPPNHPDFLIIMNVQQSASVHDIMVTLGRRARAAAHGLGLASAEQKNKALRAMAQALYGNIPAILTENAEDMKVAEAGGAAASYLDRLRLDEARVKAIGAGLKSVPRDSYFLSSMTSPCIHGAPPKRRRAPICVPETSSGCCGGAGRA